MKEIIKMLVVLTAISGICGFLLAGVRSATSERIEEQELLNVKGPAVKSVLSGSDNDFIKDRQVIELGGKKYTVFIGKKDGKPWAMAYEVSGKGFGGDIGVMLGFDLESDSLTGIGITLHKETPGLGSRITEETFSGGFKGRGADRDFKIKGDGGEIDAITGATVSSRGVCAAVNSGAQIYGNLKALIR